MRDHTRILGTLLLAWGVSQAAVALVVAARAPDLGGGRGVLLVVLGLAMGAAYAWTGVRLRNRDARARLPAIVLCVLALLSFPLGTAVGGYGLWVLFRKRSAAHAS
jgi:putative Mn2+ efflux pump MntP